MEVIKLNKNDVIVLEFEQPLTEEQYETIRKTMSNLSAQVLIVEPEGMRMFILKAEEENDDGTD